MKQMKLTHYLDIIKKEPGCHDEKILKVILERIDIKQECYIKEELDLPWDEGDNDFDSISFQLDNSTGTKEIKKTKESSDANFDKRFFIHQKENVSGNAANISFQLNNPIETKETKKIKRNKKTKGADFDKRFSTRQKENASGNAGFLQHYKKFCPKCDKIEPCVSTKKILVKRKKEWCQKCDTRLNYECLKCNKRLAARNGMIKHLKSKCLKKGYYFACLKCDFKSISKSNLKSHLQVIHSIARPALSEYMKQIESEDVQNDVISRAKSHKCSKCGKQFLVLARLLKHVQDCGQTKENANSDDPAKQNSIQGNFIHHCEKCNITVENDDTAGSFVTKKCQSCDSKFSFKCKLCDRIFDSYYKMRQHFRSSHAVSKQVFKCPECDYETKLISYLAKHVRHKHVVDNHECPKCGGKYKNRSLYKIHALYCKRAPQFQCDHCPFKSKKKLYLKDHIFRAHCKDIHVDSTHKTMYFNCDDCKYKSRFKRDIINHVRRHLQDNIKACPVCKKRFSAHYLKQHEKYCGKEPLKCEYCDYHTLIKGALIQHIANKHSKGQQRECPKYHKTWKYNGYLKAHLKRCGIEFPFQCDLCSYKAKFKTVLRKHIETTHLKSKKRRLA